MAGSALGRAVSHDEAELLCSGERMSVCMPKRAESLLICMSFLLSNNSERVD